MSKHEKAWLRSAAFDVSPTAKMLRGLDEIAAAARHPARTSSSRQALAYRLAAG